MSVVISANAARGIVAGGYGDGSPRSGNGNPKKREAEKKRREASMTEIQVKKLILDCKSEIRIAHSKAFPLALKTLRRLKVDQSIFDECVELSKSIQAVIDQGEAVAKKLKGSK